MATTTITTTTKTTGRTTAATSRALKAANIIPTGRGMLDSDIASFVGAVNSAEQSASDAMHAISRVYDNVEWTLVKDADGKEYKSWTAFYNAVIGPSGIPVKTATLYLRAQRVTAHAIPDTATSDAVDGWKRLKGASPSVVKNLAALFVRDKDGNNVLADGQEGVYNRMGAALREMDTITARGVEEAYRAAKNPYAAGEKAERTAAKKAAKSNESNAVNPIFENIVNGNTVDDLPQLPIPAVTDLATVDGEENARMSMDIDAARSMAGAMFRALNEIGKLPKGTLTDETIQTITTACSMFRDIAHAFEAEPKK